MDEHGRPAQATAFSEIEGLFDAVLDAQSSHAVVLDQEGLVTYASRSWYAIARAYGAAANAVGVGVNYLEICRAASDDPIARAALDGIQAVAARSIKSFILEYPCHSTDERRWFRMSVNSMPATERSVVVIHTDVTERTIAEQRVQEAEKRNRELRSQLLHAERVNVLTTLSGSIAHELSQPFATVAANSRAALRLLDGTPPDLGEIRAALLDVVDGSQRAKQLLDHLKDLLKKRPPVPTTFSLNRSLLDVVRLIHRDLEQRKIELHLQLDPSIPQVTGDKLQVQQAVLNLLLNASDAVSANAANRPRAIRLETAPAPHGRVGISVVDSGPGLSDEQRARMFEPFYTTKPEGLGLGLAICRDIAEAHESSLRSTPNPEGGLTMSFSLRLAQAGDERAISDN